MTAGFTGHGLGSWPKRSPAGVSDSRKAFNSQQTHLAGEQLRPGWRVGQCIQAARSQCLFPWALVSLSTAIHTGVHKALMENKNPLLPKTA